MSHDSPTPSSEPEKTHIVWHGHSVSRLERERLAGHRGCVVWFTGLSGSGKSTVANAVDRLLYQSGARSYVLDGDNVRHSLNAGPQMLAERHGEDFSKRFGLTFTAQDREENIRRIGAVAGMFCQAGIITLTAFVSPYRRDRDAVRTQLAPDDFVEIFVDAPLAICESRDPKGLYRKARAGELKNFTGLDDPYEAPLRAELVLQSADQTPEQLASQVLSYLRERKILPSC